MRGHWTCSEAFKRPTSYSCTKYMKTSTALASGAQPRTQITFHTPPAPATSKPHVSTAPHTHAHTSHTRTETVTGAPECLARLAVLSTASGAVKAAQTGHRRHSDPVALVSLLKTRGTHMARTDDAVRLRLDRSASIAVPSSRVLAWAAPRQASLAATPRA